ncbi:MAG: hypothetical protein ABUS79_27155 [Pseudomonadota bacterium]
MNSRQLSISILAAVASVVALPRITGAATSFNITNDGFAAYTIDGVDNPTLTLTRGQTYTFNVTAVGHPFWIATVRGAGGTESNAFSAGVTNNGASPGTITFAVPTSAPAVLFYQCNYHDPMGGTLAIVSPPPSVPSLGVGALCAVVLVLLALGSRRLSLTRP